MENGGSPAESVENLRKSQQITTKGNRAESVIHGVNHVVSEILSQIRNEGNWKRISLTD
jgi:hypothetical protein